jgi:hypothetical protein
MSDSVSETFSDTESDMSSAFERNCGENADEAGLAARQIQREGEFLSEKRKRREVKVERRNRNERIGSGRTGAPRGAAPVPLFWTL